MIEKTADEMLEELGYYKFSYENGDNFMCYRNDKERTSKFLVFDLKRRNYAVQYGYNQLPLKILITTEEHKTITKKMEELGWLERK